MQYIRKVFGVGKDCQASALSLVLKKIHDQISLYDITIALVKKYEGSLLTMISHQAVLCIYC